MEISMKRHPQILNCKKTGLLIIDVQEKITKVMRNHLELVENICKLVKAIKIFEIPVWITEQYPKGLGNTVKPIAELAQVEALQKMSFSCSGIETLFSDIKEKGVEQLIVVGIESHVCVQQTALDLLADGFQVYIGRDLVSSRKKLDYKTAIKRMERAGVVIGTLESFLFELLEVSGTEQFKKISKLIK